MIILSVLILAGLGIFALLQLQEENSPNDSNEPAVTNPQETKAVILGLTGSEALDVLAEAGFESLEVTEPILGEAAGEKGEGYVGPTTGPPSGESPEFTPMKGEEEILSSPQELVSNARAVLLETERTTDIIDVFVFSSDNFAAQAAKAPNETRTLIHVCNLVIQAEKQTGAYQEKIEAGRKALEAECDS